MRVLWFAPHTVLDGAVAETFASPHEVEVVAVADDLSSASLQSRRLTPDVVVVTARVTHRLRRLCDTLATIEPRPRVLVVDEAEDDHALLRAVEAGADGYVADEAGAGAIAAGIRALAGGETVVPQHMLGRLLRRLIDRQREIAHASERLIGLTPREREVLALLADGFDAPAIAGRLVISPETVRTHIQRILRKLDVHSRGEAIALVAHSGLAERLERLVEGSPA